MRRTLTRGRYEYKRNRIERELWRGPLPEPSLQSTMMLPLVLYGLLLSIASAAVRYDQAQTGDYNVHLDLKNIEVLAFLDGSSLGLGDYEYDYGEYTIKPPPNSTNGHGGPQNAGTSSSAAPISVSPIDSNSTSVSEGNNTDVNGIKEIDTNSTESNVVIESTTKPPRRCGAGFYRDPAGRCRRLRRPVKLSGLLNQAKNRISG